MVALVTHLGINHCDNRKPRDCNKVGRHQKSEPAAEGAGPYFSCALQALQSVGMLLWFGQKSYHRQSVGQRHRCCEPKWCYWRDQAEKSAESRTENESNAKGGADQTDSARPIFWRRDIGNISGCGSNACTRNSRDNSRQKEHRQRVRIGHQNVPRGRTKETAE